MNGKREEKSSPFGTPIKPNPEDFESNCTSEMEDSDIQDRYLTYFKEEFRLWRNLFESKGSQERVEEGLGDNVESEAGENWSR